MTTTIRKPAAGSVPIAKKAPHTTTISKRAPQTAIVKKAAAQTVIVTQRAPQTITVPGGPHFAGLLPPTLTSLNFVLGDINGGGLSIVGTGTALAGATAVAIGGNVIAPSSSTSTTVTFPLPAHVAGAVTVSVTTPGGTSGTQPFTYWSPLQITDLQAYLDSSMGVTGASPITQWADQSSNAYLFDVFGGAPTISASQFGSLPSVNFDGLSAFYNTIGNLYFVTGCSFFWVGKWTNTKSVATGVFEVPQSLFGDTAGYGPGPGASADQIALYGYAVEVDAGSGMNDGNPHLVGWTFDDTNTATPYKGNVQQGAALTTANFYTTLSGWYYVGCGYAGPTVGQDGFIGDVGACIVTTSVMGPTDMANLNAWAQQRFGVV